MIVNDSNNSASRTKTTGAMALWLAILVLPTLSASARAANVGGIWALDSDLSASQGASTLTADGWSPTFASVSVADRTASVLEVPAFTPSQLLTVGNSIGANGGGVYTNVYTIAMDINFLNLETYESILQTNTSNGNDTDIYTTAAGAIDPGGVAGAVAANTWYRLTFTNDGSEIRYYRDGVQIGSTTAGVGLDANKSLDSVFHLFADQNGDTGTKQVNSIAYFGEVLFDDRIASMGGASAAPITYTSVAPAVGIWHFDGDLTNAVAGSTASLTAIGFSPSYTTASINGNTAGVLDLAALPTSAERLRVDHTIGANGGGIYTNNYTLGMDVYFPNFDNPYASLLQTNTSNGNDVDLFVYTGSGEIGISGATTSGAGVDPTTWYRIIMTNEIVGGVTETKVYINGVLVGQATTALDAVFSLDSVFHLFSDDTGNTLDTLVNSVALWDYALSATQVAALGSAAAPGFVNVPAPAALPAGLALLAMAATRRRRN